MPNGYHPNMKRKDLWQKSSSLSRIVNIITTLYLKCWISDVFTLRRILDSFDDIRKLFRPVFPDLNCLHRFRIVFYVQSIHAKEWSRLYHNITDPWIFIP